MIDTTCITNKHLFYVAALVLYSYKVCSSIRFYFICVYARARVCVCTRELTCVFACMCVCA